MAHMSVDVSILSILQLLILAFVAGRLFRVMDRLKKKYCPRCKERMRYKSLKCSSCGYEFPSENKTDWSTPFYKS
jgi:tRNA(Ile2) C34 agmatinyltransferase TiaS